MSSDIKRKNNTHQITAKNKRNEIQRKKGLDNQQSVQKANLQHRKNHEEAKRKKEEKEGLLGRIVQAGLSSVVTNLMVGTIANSVTAKNIPDQPRDIDKIPDMKGDVIKGPKQGGGFLERPIAGGMADASLNQSLAIDYSNQSKVTEQAGKGALSVDGVDIPVKDYFPDEMPKSALYKAATGQELTATDGIALGVERGLSQARNGDSSNQAQRTAKNTETQGQDTNSDIDNINESGAGDEAMLAIGAYKGATMLNSMKNDPKGVFGKEKDSGYDLGSVESQRDELEQNHIEKVKEAVRTQDIGEAQTEGKVGGKNVTISTVFEATAPDNMAEQKAGASNVSEAMTTPQGASTKTTEEMYFRTQIERDQGGMSLKPNT